MRSLLILYLALSFGSVFAEDEPDVDGGTEQPLVCDEIRESPLPDDDIFFNFHQHDERLDPNQFVKVVFKIMSKLKPDPIKKVQLDYNPILQHLVGPYSMRSTVSHQTKTGEIVDHCYDIIIQIHDTNECTHSEKVDWVHTCDDSAQCVNTQGGYYCACPAGHFAVAGSGDGKCNGDKDSTSCCGDVTYDGHPHGDVLCRADFRCHADSCASNDCDPNASCIEGDKPNDFTCECNSRYRDVSPDPLNKPGRACAWVDHCEEPGACPVGCRCRSVTTPTEDGFHCDPIEGHAIYYPRSEYEWVTNPYASPFRLDENPHLCASQKAPELTLRGESPHVLTQGQKYVELGVTITDESTVDLKRRFTTDYSNAEALMDLSGFTKKCGTSSIAYSLAVPWVAGRESVDAERTVVVVDADECTYDGEDSDFRHSCQFPAECMNIDCAEGGGYNVGEPSYTCNCNMQGFELNEDNFCVKVMEGPFSEDSQERFADAMDLIRWNFFDLSPQDLSSYKTALKHLHEVASSQDKSDLPPPYEWDSPYRNLALAQLRKEAVHRGVATTLGAASATKAALVSTLAWADHKDFHGAAPEMKK